MQDEKCMVCGKVLDDGDIIITEERDDRGKVGVYVVDTDLCRECITNQLTGVLASSGTASA
jgi:hypothetical protein